MSRILTETQKEAILGFMSRKYTILLGGDGSGKTFVADIIAAEMFLNCLNGGNVLITSDTQENLHIIRKSWELMMGSRFIDNGRFFTIKAKNTAECKFYFMLHEDKNAIAIRGLSIGLWYADNYDKMDTFFLSTATRRLTEYYSKGLMIGGGRMFDFGPSSIYHVFNRVDVQKIVYGLQ